MLLSAFFYKAPLSVIVLILFTGVFLFYFIGVRISDYKRRHRPESIAGGIGPLEAALLGLLSLLLSFTFGLSSSRYDARRALIVQESNDIGTVILRSDMYADSVRSEFRKDLQDYVEARIGYYEASDEAVIDQKRSEAEKISGRIWKRAVNSSKANPDVVKDNQMIPAINSMIDIVGSRDASRLARVPDLIISLLISLTLLGSFVVGYSKKESGNDRIMLTLYAVMTIMTIYTIIDLDRPRRGLIKTNVPHEKINELRNYFSGDSTST
jgi:hypothetical protein